VDYLHFRHSIALAAKQGETHQRAAQRGQKSAEYSDPQDLGANATAFGWRVGLGRAVGLEHDGSSSVNQRMNDK
jgi:hypothetical protein